MHAKRQAFAFITKEAVVKKLFDEIAPEVRRAATAATPASSEIGPRRGDGAEMAIIELV